MVADVGLWLRDTIKCSSASEPPSIGNGRRPVNITRLFCSALRRIRAASWAWHAFYECLEMRSSWEKLRAEKYFAATELSVLILEEAYGAVTSTEHRYLHRHAAITCYLDGVTDSGDLGWAVRYGMAVFGLGELPAFLDGHGGAFRSAAESDLHRLRLMCNGKEKGAMMASLLDAAGVERGRGELRTFEEKMRYKVESNLACIRPFLEGLDDVLVPLSVVYTVMDDAMDVLEDTESGQSCYMTSAEEIKLSGNVARHAMRELNARAGGDWAALAKTAVACAVGGADAQLKTRNAAQGAPVNVPLAFVVQATVIIFCLVS